MPIPRKLRVHGFAARVADRLDGCNDSFHEERGREDRDTEGKVDITKPSLRPRARADHLDVHPYGSLRREGVVHLVQIETMRLHKSQNE